MFVIICFVITCLACVLDGAQRLKSVRRSMIMIIAPSTTLHHCGALLQLPPPSRQLHAQQCCLPQAGLCVTLCECTTDRIEAIRQAMGRGGQRLNFSDMGAGGPEDILLLELLGKGSFGKVSGAT